MKTINIYKNGEKIYCGKAIWIIFQKDGTLEIYLEEDEGVAFERNEYDWFNIV